MGWFLISAAIGYLNGNMPLSVIIMDLFRVAFFGDYFPLAYYISVYRFSKDRIINILKYSALTLSYFYDCGFFIRKNDFQWQFFGLLLFYEWVL